MYFSHLQLSQFASLFPHSGGNTSTASPSPSPSGTPDPSPTPDATLAPVNTDPATALKGPINVPADFQELDLRQSGNTTPGSEAKSWIESAIRSDGWLYLALTSKKPDILNTLSAGHPELVYGKLAGLLAGAQTPPTVSGNPPKYIKGSLIRLTDKQKRQISANGATILSNDAVFLTLVGAPTTTTIDGKTLTIVPAQETNVLLSGKFVQDPNLGDVWVTSFAALCNQSTITTGTSCHRVDG